MRTLTKALTAVTAVGLAASMAACSSSKDTKPQYQFTSLSGQSTTVVLAPSFLTALKTLGVSPGKFGSASIVADGSNTDAVFPITGGKATVYKKGVVTPYVQGVIDHNGSGLTLTAAGITTTLKNFVVNPGNDSNLTGEVDVTKNGATTVFAKSARLFDLDGSTLQPITVSGGVATLQGTTIYLSSTAAGALNKVYGLTGAKALAGNKKVEIGTAIIKATGTAG